MNARRVLPFLLMVGAVMMLMQHKRREFMGQCEEGEKRAKGSMEDALAAEKVHAQLYAQAQAAVAAAADATFGSVFVCGVCGFTIEGDAPDKCPVCSAPKDKLVTF